MPNYLSIADSQYPSIKTVAVIGAGTMGSGIAGLVASAGMKVYLLDVVTNELTEEDKAKGWNKESKGFRNKLADGAKSVLVNRKRPVVFDLSMGDNIVTGNLSDDLGVLGECDWVVEAIVENLEIKQQLLDQILPHCKEVAILSTNTSGISINKIIEKQPENVRKRFLGTHFFNPPRYMRLLELIPNQDTCPKVLDLMKEFGKTKLGKGVVVAKDTPNFIANRIGVYSSCKAFELMDEYGFNFEKVDAITGKAMGRAKTATFGTLDLVGLDILVAVTNTMLEQLDDGKERDIFKLPDFYQAMIDNKQLGNKTRCGFYKRVKEKGKTQRLVWDVEKKEYVPQENEKSDFLASVLKERSLGKRLEKLVYADNKESQFAWDLIKSILLYSAELCPQISDSFIDMDKAMKWGYNWQAGPFEMWDMIGLHQSLEKMKRENLTIPKWVEDLAGSRDSFYDKDQMAKPLSQYEMIKDFKCAALRDMGDGVACFEIKSPGNAISTELKDALRESITYVENSGDYRGLVLANDDRNFLNGADLVEFRKQLEAKDYDTIAKSIDEFHETSMMIKGSKKPIVGALKGNALGGGLEFLLHTHQVVAHVDSYVGLVEVGVGIIPGGGGCTQSLLRNMKQVEAFKLPDVNPVLFRAFENIAMAKVSTNAFEAKAYGYLRETDRIIMDIDALYEEAKASVIKLHGEGFRPVTEQKIRVQGSSGRAFLESIIKNMHDGKMISDHDVVILKELAWVLTGGDSVKGNLITETMMNELEKQAILRLIRFEKTHQRVDHILKTGRPLRN